ncbi:unnamed protein product [Porites evermanni]|uniref:Uncharacterized protein n=1 Tax=Porites evermanni TaxID=104178 RepID=A0ABN8M766_9CNID|nr:unnamed protein product [Porites evermanni]
MASTENLLQYSDITTNTLESGYHSDSHELDNGSSKKRANKKKNYQRRLGLENEGFEPDREHVDTGAKHRVQVHRRALSEKASTVPEAKTNTVQRKDKRRHSYAEGTTVDRANITDGVIQRVRTPRRRTSSTEIDLRRRACLNSMRLRRVSSSSQQPLSEIDNSADDDVFYIDDFRQETRNTSREAFSFDGDGRDKTREERKEIAMDRVCSALELENVTLDKYSRRLSSALEERAALKEELNVLRRAVTVPSLTAEEKLKKGPKIHFQSEKLNSLRRQNIEKGNKNYLFEHLRRSQMEERRKLPDVPRTSRVDNNEIFDESPDGTAGKEGKLHQCRDTEDSLSLSSDEYELPHRETSLKAKKKGKSSFGRSFSKESPLYLTGKDGNDNYFLSEVEKKRREKNIADLAADLWQKLLLGEKFHGDENTTRETSLPDEIVKNKATEEGENSSKSKEDPLYAKPRIRERTEKDHMGDLVHDSSHSIAHRNQESRTMATSEGTAHARSESASDFVGTSTFKRNQRRPIRYRRSSSTTESLSASKKASFSRPRLSCAEQEGTPQVQQGESDTSTTMNPQEKSERLPPARVRNFIFQGSTEAVSQNHSKWFDYMLPPGKRGFKKECSGSLPDRSADSLPYSPSTSLCLTEKLRYYQDLQEKRTREEDSFGLADAYMASQDPEGQKELRSQAAGRAAILRREASHLLWEAMNLEQICDPNARVRHIFTPY